MTISTEKIKRYKDFTVFLIKHARSEVFSSKNEFEELLPEEDLNRNVYGDPEEFVQSLEEMGPTFIKLGQLLSTRPDFLPPAYIKALSRLQDKVGPFSFEEVEKIVIEELGVRISKGFRFFSAEPLAAASLGQVHKAETHDGKVVAVKVQRPEIRTRIMNDLEALSDIAATFEKHTEAGKKFRFSDILNEFKKSIIKELDYRQEAQNLIRLNSDLKEYKHIVVPLPVEDYTTSKVLTMEFIKGKKITSLSPLSQIEFDGSFLIEELFKAYLDQVLINGFFHADPHPGNVFLTEDKRIALIDLGMTARVDPAMQEKLIRLLLYISEGRGYETAELGLTMSSSTEISNKDKFFREVSEFVGTAYNARLEQIQMGRVVMELSRIASENGYRTPTELTMIGKALLNLDEIGKTLEPEFNPNECVREHTESIVRKHLLKNLSQGNIFSSLLETKSLIQNLPVRINKITEMLANNELTFKTKAFDENLLTENFQKVANRITLGLVLAALIIGAAMLMNVKSTFTILGYPGIAMIMFVIAAICGFGLVFSILLKDKKQKKTQ